MEVCPTTASASIRSVDIEARAYDDPTRFRNEIYGFKVRTSEMTNVLSPWPVVRGTGFPDQGATRTLGHGYVHSQARKEHRSKGIAPFCRHIVQDRKSQNKGQRTASRFFLEAKDCILKPQWSSIEAKVSRSRCIYSIPRYYLLSIFLFCR